LECCLISVRMLQIWQKGVDTDAVAVAVAISALKV
jgi:hypothetical protein